MSLIYALNRPGINKSKETLAAACLMELMSEISESHYCASWMRDLEYNLWSMLQGGSRKYGLGEVSEEEINLLKNLSDTCNGWWVWVGDGIDSGEVFVTIDEWDEIYANR